MALAKKFHNQFYRHQILVQPIKMTTQHAPRRAYLFSFGGQKLVAQGKFLFFWDFVFPSCSMCVPTIHAPLIDLGQNRWWQQLGILGNFAQPMKLHDASNGPLLGRVGGMGVKPLLFSMCSHQVLIVFLSRTQWVPNIFLNIFPIVPPFVPYALPIVVLLEPIWLARNWYFHFLYIWREYFYIVKYPKF